MKLNLFRRKLNVSSDEIWIGSLYGIIIRALSIVLSSVYLGRASEGCLHNRRLTFYMGSLILLSFINILIETVMYTISLRGTVANDMPRRKIQ